MEEKKISLLLNEYSERCADQRAKAEQYAKLWIYMLSVLLILIGVTFDPQADIHNIADSAQMTDMHELETLRGAQSAEENEGSSSTKLLISPKTQLIIQALLLLMVLIIISFIYYTNVTHSILLKYLQYLENRIGDEGGFQPMWFIAVRETTVHSANGWRTNPTKASFILLPLGAVIGLAIGIIFWKMHQILNDDYLWFVIIAYTFVGIVILLTIVFALQKYRINHISFTEKMVKF